MREWREVQKQALARGEMIGGKDFSIVVRHHLSSSGENLPEPEPEPLSTAALLKRRRDHRAKFPVDPALLERKKLNP